MKTKESRWKAGYFVGVGIRLVVRPSLSAHIDSKGSLRKFVNTFLKMTVRPLPRRERTWFVGVGAGSVFVNAPPLRTFVRLCIFEWTWSAREVRVG